MNQTRFLETRRPAWERLGELVAKTRGKGPKALTDDELHELTRLYPAVAVDVARARTLKIDRNTQRYVNRVAIAAHGLLYRRRRVRPLQAIGTFFGRDYPRLFRKLWVYTTLATTIFLVTASSVYLATLVRPATAHLFVPGQVGLPDRESGLTAEDMSSRFRQTPAAPMTAGIMTNNISVAFYAFALGITAGLGTCYVLLFNAMMMGAFAGHFFNHGLSYAFWSFIVPHGVLEIMAIMIAGGAGLRLGMSLAIPGSLGRVASLRRGAREAVLLVLGTIPMFAVAGIVEGFVTPAEIPGGAKIFLGILLGAATLTYLLLTGRTSRGGSRRPLKAVVSP